MRQNRVPINRLTWGRLAREVREFSTSDVGAKASSRGALLVAFLVAINLLNVWNSYVGRDFMTAIADRNRPVFLFQAGLYLAVFAASTLVAVIHRFTEERLGLLWREWLTRRLVGGYLAERVYYRLDSEGTIANPDQRIADDARAFTTTTLSFALILLNGSFTTLAFAGVMWSISPLLFAVAVGYAALGTLLTIVLGRPLVWLSYSQLDREANLRADLIHVRENAESIALLRREGRLGARIVRSLEELTANARHIIAVNRKVGFFTTGYNYLIPILPALVVAPLYFRGQVEFGVIPQSAMAFSQLLGAFSLIVNQFQSLSSFAAVIARVGSLREAVEQAPKQASGAIEIAVDDERVAWEGLTLRAPKDGRVLVRNLTLSIPHGTCVLIVGPNTIAKMALFRATAGIWSAGHGRIFRPGLENMLFLPERPYLPPGDLREVLVRTGREEAVAEARILDVLRALGVDSVVAQAGGLGIEQDWDDLLSLGEQQLLAFARLILAAPRFAFLDRVSTALGPAEIERALRVLFGRGITYLTCADGDDAPLLYDTVLEIEADGSWSTSSMGTVRRAR